MSFLNPTLALAALACVCTPIIIHLLFRRKRRPIEWGAMRFVLEAFRRHRRRLRLEQILLLLARTLAVLLLALAVGRPMFAGNTPLEARKPRDLLLVIDNSLASQSRTQFSNELALSKQAAARLLDELDPVRGDRAALIALGSPAERIVTPPTGEVAAVQNAIEQLQPSDAAADLAGAAGLVREFAGKDSRRETTVALLSAFRAGTIDIAHDGARAPDAPDTARDAAPAAQPESPINLLATPPTTEPADNLSIVNVEPLRSILIRAGDGPETQQARATLRRAGPSVEKAAVATLRLRTATARSTSDDQHWASTTVRFSPWQESVTVLAPVGISKPSEGDAPGAALWIEGRIDEDAIQPDNMFRRPWKSREQVRVAIIAPPSDTAASSGPESFSAADWISLALTPTGATRGVGLENENEPVRVARIAPERLSPIDLAGIDAAFVARPEMLGAAAWPVLAEFARRGGLLVVSPAPLPGAQLWTDPFTKAAGLSWAFSRESETPKAPLLLSIANADQALLSALGAELPELIKPVSASRLLGVELKGDGSSLISFDSQHPLLIAARPGGSTKGLVAAFLVSPELAWTNLPAMPLMVPLIQELVRQGVGLASGANCFVAGVALEAPDELRAIEPPGSGAVDPIARRSGLWRRVDSRGTTRELVAVNSDPQAGSTLTQTREQLAPYLGKWLRSRDFVWIEPGGSARPGAKGVLTQSRRSPPIDLPLLIAGLALLVLDLALSRWFSHATVTDRHDAGAASASVPPGFGADEPATREAAA